MHAAECLVPTANGAIGRKPSTVDLKRTVEPTDVTFEWILEQLDGKNQRWDQLRETTSISSVEFKLVSGAGFLSHVSRIVVSFYGEEKPFTAFLKARSCVLGVKTNCFQVPTTDKFCLITQGRQNGFEDQMGAALILYHNQEIKFYDRIARFYPHIYLPKMFAFEMSEPQHQKHGRVLFEDVGDRGVMADVIRGLSFQQTMNTVEAIAKLHVFTRYMPQSAEILQAMHETHRLDMTDKQLSIQDRLQALGVEFFAKHKQLYQTLFDHFHLQTEDPHKQFDVQPVLSHGDLWANNLLFCPDADGKPTDRLFTIIDYQCSYISHGMNDLARLLLVSCSADLLRNHTNSFLRHYFDVFGRELAANGLEVGFDFEKLKEMYRSACFHEYIFAVSAHSMYFHQAESEELRESLVQRLIAGFEPLQAELERLAAQK